MIGNSDIYIRTINVADIAGGGIVAGSVARSGGLIVAVVNHNCVVTTSPIDVYIGVVARTRRYNSRNCVTC